MGEAVIDLLKHMVSLSQKQNKKLLHIIRLLESQQIEGTTYPNRITLKVGQPVTKIDFVEQLHQNLPAGVTLDVPARPVSHIYMINEGPGDVYYATNRYNSQLTANTRMEVGDRRDIGPLAGGKIKTLNLVANNNDATVQFEALV